MTQNEFNRLLGSLSALSADQEREVLRKLTSQMLTTGHIEAFLCDRCSQLVVGDLSSAREQEQATGTLTEAEAEDQEIQRRLYDAGLISEIKPPISDVGPYRDRRPVPIKGEPLSVTVIRERR
jgi:hypothetical protein